MHGARHQPPPRCACARQDIVIERRDGDLERPFAKGHGNTQSAGSVQDPALRLKKLEPYLEAIEFMEGQAGMAVEEMKAARDEADPQLARIDLPIDDAYAHAYTCMCIPHVHVHVQMHCRQRRRDAEAIFAREAIDKFREAIRIDNKEHAALRTFGLNRSLANVQVC